MIDAHMDDKPDKNNMMPDDSFIGDNGLENISVEIETKEEYYISPEYVFSASLESLSPDDIPFNPLTVKKNYLINNVIRYAILTVCVSTLIFSGSYIVRRIIGYMESKSVYDDLLNVYQMQNVDETTLLRRLSKPRSSSAMYEVLTGNAGNNETIRGEDYDVEILDSQLKKALDQLDVIKKMNMDTFGWVYISSTDINYPVVKSIDNDYYLTHNFYKKYSSAGAIYADFNNSFKMDENRNTVLYGHNMADHSMFYQIQYFKDSANFFNNNYIELSTPDGIFIYEAFSVYRTNPYYPYIKTKFETDDEWVAFLKEIKGRSIFNKNITLTSDTRILTLSTCTNTPDDYRWAVHCVLVDVKRP